MKYTAQRSDMITCCGLAHAPSVRNVPSIMGYSIFFKKSNKILDFGQSHVKEDYLAHVEHL